MNKFLSTILFAATVLAVPSPDADATSIDSLDISDTAGLASLAAGLVVIPSSLLSVLATAVPTSVMNEILTNSEYLSSIESAAAAGTYPAWYSDLPNSIKAEATSEANLLAGALATGTGDSASAQSTASSDSSSKHATESASASASSSTSTSASSSESTGGAADPTGGVAMGVAGAAGVLAFALAL